MGTNYYLKLYRGDKCEHCGRSDELDEIHIGKSSAGWKFLFDPNYGEFPTFLAWQKMLETHPNDIYDEYGRNISLFEFYKKINDKKDGIAGPDEKLDEIVRISNYSDFG